MTTTQGCIKPHGCVDHHTKRALATHPHACNVIKNREMEEPVKNQDYEKWEYLDSLRNKLYSINQEYLDKTARVLREAITYVQKSHDYELQSEVWGIHNSVLKALSKREVVVVTEQIEKGLNALRQKPPELRVLKPKGEAEG
jgi:hypothetical protein